MKTYLKKIFFKWGIFIFDANDYKYGGFNHFIAGKIFRWKLDYLIFNIRKQWNSIGNMRIKIVSTKVITIASTLDFFKYLMAHNHKQMTNNKIKRLF